MITKLTTTQVNIIKSLAKYCFLTARQMHSIGIVSHRNNLYSHLSKLTKKYFINQTKFGVDKKKGRLPSLYSLSKKGKEFLIQELDFFPEEIKKPNKVIISTHTLQHTLDMVDCHISLARTCEKNKDFLDFLYYDFEKDDKESKTKVHLDRKDKQAIKPDIITKLNEDLIIMEVHRGRGTKRAIRQISYHLYGFAKNKNKEIGYRRAFDFQDYKILFCLKEKDYINHIIERLNKTKVIQKNIATLKNKILFKPLNNIRNIQEKKYNNYKQISSNFFDNWTNLEKEEISF